ncbi:MAG: NADH-quinone oxidoreductase subunit NuoK [Nitrospinota bacterium]|jgi:NADH-quinone oxidoreductase subunit K|nr:NADH-quinone oxidoreductase subunit NuoK [Nitrospinota bacterium]MDP7351115.1 NADH-quinone oxidoreductase subunit NuoK [Nitrospinota bacterium]MDP7554686.1 NADH-quinone oxidoreductase subunit NuoK [Nitrospinota bacterium]MDP7581312.1 NADH-quinone oxidoreductase subunit NuoK [Nitrospinota bacterium]HJN03101.1 NADH-quinone oxidoreductase subunit NuoK [Nitrospinota bacterium]|tara:strand:+ start:561 stop:863 length:303 start_codon:yes stop_codon:yes gene_type:complete
MVPLTHYLLVSAILFSLGVAGVMLRRNVIMIFMSIELMLNAVNLTFVAFSKFLNNLDGHIFTFMVMTVAAAEAAVGLAIVIAIFRNKPTANVDEINLLKL